MNPISPPQWCKLFFLFLFLFLMPCSGFASQENTLFDWQNGIHQISINLDPVLWDEIRHTARNPEVLLPICGAGPVESPFEFVRASVAVDNTIVNDVGVRTKGWWGSINPTRPSLKIKFDKFVDGQSLEGVENLTLNNNNQDPARMRTCLAYKTFQTIGYPAPDCGFAHLFVNGEDLGIYSVVEPIKKPFLRKWFSGDDGNLYESQLSDFTPYAINSWERKTNESTGDDRFDLERVMAALQADDSRLLAELEELIDMEQFYRYWAMETLIFHWDGYNGNRNNCYLYNDPATGKFVFIPWGADTSFSPIDSTLPGVNNIGPLFANAMLTKRLYNHPQARRQFADKVAELYESVWQDGRLQQQVDQIKTILAPYVSSKFNPNFSKSIRQLKRFMRSHATDVRNTIIDASTLPEYSFEYMPLCFTSRPASEPFSIAFSTKWGTTSLPGVGRFSRFELAGVKYPANAFNHSYCASAGPTTQAVPGIDNVTLNFFQFIMTLTGDRKFVGLTISLSPTQFISGEPIEIRNLTTAAVRVYSDDFIDLSSFKIDGVVTGGVLNLTQSGMNAGDVVEGTFEGEIVVEKPLTGISFDGQF